MKKPSLSAALQQHDTKAPATVAAVAEEPGRRRPIAMQPGREGKKQILGYFSAECKKQLRQMGVDLDMTEQAMLTEALNLLFAKHGKPTIA